jgi:hypothetical protein
MSYKGLVPLRKNLVAINRYVRDTRVINIYGIGTRRVNHKIGTVIF